jgi:hypothetical protein
MDLTFKDPTIFEDIINHELTNELILTTEKLKREGKKPRQPKKSDTVEPLELTYENYAKHKIDISSYKLIPLRKAAKSYKLNISGTKPLVIERIENHFKNISGSLSIQKIFRGWLVRKFIKLKGPAFNNHTICNNDNDFVTLEPLNEIDFEYFYSYTDSKNFTYGFNISSLIRIFKTKCSLMNPYNREKLSNSQLNDVITLYRITWLINTKFRNENDYLALNINNKYSGNNQRQPYYQQQRPTQTISSILDNNYQPVVNASSISTTENIERYNKIREIRTKPLEQRINNLFIEFDQLGNYTNSNWFSSLTHRDYIRLYRVIFDIWNFRQLSREIRNRICPFYGPFDGIFPRPIQHNELTTEQIKIACLIVLENLVYSGADEDTRKLGAFHALSGLTVVSSGARTSMPWLYESIVY